ncbi:MAG: cyclic nucleotide-binding domain-containing protein [Lachnospiraceae bacterium]|nr:cyclic nucleotide-binding domain-containing protein [Lachnospiraceae bacterium]
MGYTLKIAEKNIIPAGNVIFAEKEQINCICAIISGKVLVKNDYVVTAVSKGGFIGVSDLSAGRYTSDYIAETDTILFPFEVADMEGLRNVFKAYSKDYKGLVISSLAKTYADVLKINLKYKELAKSLYTVMKDAYQKYLVACKNGGMASEILPGLANMKPFAATHVIDERNIASFMELNAIPTATMSSFFGNAMELTMDNIINLTVAISEMMAATSETGEYIHDQYTNLYNDGERNLLSFCIKLSKDLDKAGRADKSLETLCTELVEMFNKAEDVAIVTMGIAHPVKRDRLNKLYESLTSGEEIVADSEDSSAKDEDLYRSLKNSIKTILNFGKVDGQLAIDFELAVNNFVDSNERFSTEDEGRQLRRKVSEHFYKVYNHVFRESMTVSPLPKPVELFLNFGFTDERLLTKEQAIELCKITVSSIHRYHCNIFTIPEWLTAIYNGKREPSKNEFDLEYAETLRELKKTHEIDDEEERRRLNNPDMRLDFEIYNMFKSNHRVVNGQPSIFVPILCSEQMTAGASKAIITKDRMGQLVNKYRDLDIGVFRREIMYANKEKKIEKEIIQLEVGPDIILFPAYGTNAAMWQEISCKKRDSAGRMLFPIMMDGAVDDSLIRCFARFRWELCRTMQGTAWNNIQFKSLTSEYSDYIQFYRKNHELSEEKKEKVKNQLVKGKNNAREVFVQDYEAWIKYESSGGMKLNKTSREILAMYCPFNAEIRRELETQPAFADAIGRYNREAQKRAKEIELRHRALMKVCPEIPEIMLDTLRFYKEM